MMRKEFTAYTQAILDCKAHFETMLTAIVQESNEAKQQTLAKKALDFAMKASTGYYSSDIIENVFVRLAQKHSLDTPPSKMLAGTFLHVMTETYKTGGHTRVVERWIESADTSQTHSLVLTKPKKTVPTRLQKAVAAKNGTLTLFQKNLSDLEKGLKLREMALRYEYVILHVHPYDIIPLIAFGTKEFTRPVIFFNHADHRFWVGVSIADRLAEFRTWGQEISFEKRGVQHSFILGLPIDTVKMKEEAHKKALKAALHLPKDKKIIVSVGSAHKYKALLGISLLTSIEKILSAQDDALCIFVGLHLADIQDLKELSKKLGNRIHAVGNQAPEKMFKYLGAADLVLDSFPMSGGVALIDAVSCQKPVLSLCCPTGQLDYVISSTAYCEEAEDLVDTAIRILRNENLAKEYAQNVQKHLAAHAGQAIWKERVQALYASVDTHSIHAFATPKTQELTDLDAYLYSEECRLRRKFHIPYLVTLNSYKNNGKRHKELVFFNKYSYRFAIRNYM